ncbi:MAG: glycosyltransferase family 4 protein [Armatimonadetes bacterium]|nr:glycosyltransferase family 4 protein [Armatimonadota bacterium]
MSSTAGDGMGVAALGALRVCIGIGVADGPGAAPVCRDLASELAQRGHDVTLVTCGLGGQGTWRPPGAPARFVNLDLLGLPTDEQNRRIWHWFNAHPQDVFYLNQAMEMEPTLGCLPVETRTYYGVHGLRLGIHLAAREQAGALDRLLCVSEGCAQRVYREWRLSERKVAVLHNGLALPPRRLRPVRLGPIRLVYVGRFDPVKGVYDLPKVARELQARGVDYRLGIYGGTDARLAAQLEAAGAGDRALICGWIPNDEVRLRLAEADVLLLPSRTEALPVAIIEALAAGVVPISYRGIGGPDEMIADGLDGFLAPLGDVKAVADRIAELSRDPDRLAVMAERGRATAESRFSVERMADRFVELVAEDFGDPQRSVARREGPPAVGERRPLGLAHRAYLRLPEAVRYRARAIVSCFPGLARRLWGG